MTMGRKKRDGLSRCDRGRRGAEGDVTGVGAGMEER